MRERTEEVSEPEFWRWVVRSRAGRVGARGEESKGEQEKQVSFAVHAEVMHRKETHPKDRASS